MLPPGMNYASRSRAEADAGRDERANVERCHDAAAIEANGGAMPQLEVTALRRTPGSQSLSRSARFGHVASEKWLANVEHDQNNRKDRIVQMVAGGPSYRSDSTETIIQRQLALFTAVSAHKGQVRHLKHGPTVDSSWTKFDKELSVLVSNTELVIRGASPLDVIAYLMDVDGRHAQSCRNPHVDVRLEIREVWSMHHIVTLYEIKMPPFHNRTFLSALVWKKLSDSQYVWCACPIAHHPSVPPSDESHAVRAELSRCLRLTVLAEGVTRVEYACTVDLKGSTPAWLTNSLIVPTLMHTPYTLQEYFAQIRPIDDCTAIDGAFIGHMLMDAALRASKRRRAAAVATFISRTEMLREAPLAHLDTLLQSTICTSSLRVLAGAVATQDPAQLAAAEADIIGKGIRSIVRGHKVPARAVAELLEKYPVLCATAQQLPWFEPMLTATIARRMAVSMSRSLRLALITSLSLLDVGSDLWTMLIYFLSEQYLTGSLILMMVCFSIGVQAVVVFFNNKHRSAGEIAKEMLILLSFFKPMIDLRRLMDGHKVDGAPVDTATERSYCKVIETACQSVPASIITMVALLLSGRWAWAPIVSIVISWITTAFKVTSLSVDLDTDHAKRKLNPWFYGCVRSARRRIVKACLFVLTLAHVVERTAALTLLLVTSKSWLGALLGTEMGLFLLYKASRSDLIYWVSGMGHGSSLIARVVSKLMLDFCGLPQTRHPYEAGGAYWLFSIVTNQAVCCISVWAYAEHFDGPDKLDGDLLFTTFGVLAGVWAAALTGFLLSIERAYLSTFVSLETGRACEIRCFREAEGDDERRIGIFRTNKVLWESIRDEVAAWSQANYCRWLAEQPAWLTPGLLDKIPDHCIPKLRFVYEPALVSRHKGVRGLDGDLD
jgi:hypothetical protein